MLNRHDRLDTVNVQTEVLDQDWDPIEANWTTTLDVMMEYDPRGRLIEQTIYLGFFNTLMPQSNILITYDMNGRPSLIVSRGWNGGAWQTGARDTIIYDVSGSPIERETQLFNGSGWDRYQRYVVSYDPGHKPVSRTRQVWAGGAWVNSARDTMTYDGEGRESELLSQTWAGSSWANNLRDTYSWDVNSNRIGEVDQFWSGGAWNDEKRYTWMFDGSNFLIEEIVEKWKSSAWVNDTREAYANGSAGYPEEILRQYWDGLAWTDETNTYVIFDDTMIVEQYTTRWTGSTWVNHHKTSYSWQQVITSSEITQQYPVNDKWNMVSVPLDVIDHSKSAIFPTSVSNAFAFDAGYTAAATLENGRGYWLKFDGAQNVPVTGLQVTVDTIDVAAGWNMVGSVGVPVATASITSVPGGLVSSNFFAFDNGYSSASTIEPGKGYWVKMTQAGQIVLGGTGNTPVAARLRMELTAEAPPPPPVDDDAPGASALHYSLDQNYPNPFNPVTTIRYALPAGGHVVVSVFNVVGQEVARLVDGEQGAGGQTVSFDASNLPSGVYICRITAGAFTDSKRMLLVR